MGQISAKYLFKLLGPEPAFGRLGLGGSSGGYSSHGYTSHASIRAYGAQLGGDSLFLGRLTKLLGDNLFKMVKTSSWVSESLYMKFR